ncbi:TPA: hypothetical protein ACX8DA_001591 [Campylobacter jejuni]|nr:hypothetical protein [Campylobacter jejuni]
MKMKILKILFRLFLISFVIWIILLIWGYFTLKDDYNALVDIEKVKDMNESVLLEKYKSTDKQKIMNKLFKEYLENRK